MSSTSNSYQAGSDHSQTDVENAIAIGQSIASLELTGEHPQSSPVSKPIVYDESTVGGIVAWLMSPEQYLSKIAAEQPSKGEVNGVSPNRIHRENQTFSVDSAGIDTQSDQMVFQEVNEPDTPLDGNRVLIDAPKPWECPDDMRPSNNIIKTTSGWKWLDKKKLWSIPLNELDTLRSRVVKEGYQWREDSEKHSERTNDESVLDQLTTFVRRGDSVNVEYRVKSRVGTKKKHGEVNRVVDKEGANFNSDSDQKINIIRGDGMTNTIKIDSRGVLSIFSSGKRLLGRVIEVDVSPYNGG